MTNRLEARLGALRSEGRRGVLPFITCGDGGMDVTLAVLRALDRAGAACIELGFPFSDPIADGPVLQAASQRALERGTTFAEMLDVAREFRGGSETPLVLLTYANPLFARGLERAASELAQAGFDGLLAVDVPVEESAPFQRAAAAVDLCPIYFASPTSNDARIRAAAAASRGFLYTIGRFGVTGARTSLDAAALAFLARVRELAGPLPIAVGFGIATPAQVRAAVASADLAIVGSALVEHIQRAIPDGRESAPREAARAAEAFLRPLMEALEP